MFFTFLILLSSGEEDEIQFFSFNAFFYVKIRKFPIDSREAILRIKHVSMLQICLYKVCILTHLPKPRSSEVNFNSAFKLMPIIIEQSV